MRLFYWQLNLPFEMGVKSYWLSLQQNNSRIFPDLSSYIWDNLYEEAGSLLKKIAIFVAALIILYSIYYDLTTGTLPVSMATAGIEEHKSKQDQPAIPYTTKKVKRGDTVLSIAENIHDGPLPVPIEQMVDDFRELNGQIEPNHIQINETYKFPVYK